MKSRIIVSSGIVVLIAVSWAHAQQSTFSGPGTSVPPALPGSSYSLSQQPDISSRPSVPKPPAASLPQPIQGEVVTQDLGIPHYPYPPYPNPFYQGASQQDPLAEGVQWLRGLPSNVVHRVSAFIDTNLFPKKAATHGGASPAPSSISAPEQISPTPFVPKAPQSEVPQPSLPGLLPGTR